MALGAVEGGDRSEREKEIAEVKVEVGNEKAKKYIAKSYKKAKYGLQLEDVCQQRKEKQIGLELTMILAGN